MIDKNDLVKLKLHTGRLLILTILRNQVRLSTARDAYSFHHDICILNKDEVGQLSNILTQILKDELI